MVSQAIIDLPEICYQLGVRHVVISPGSRSAPLTLSFARYENIEKKIIPDERSAGFIGLGIAQKSNRPVVLICTSGSAAYNYAPAVAEAYFRKVPLLVFTADRPPEWIDQYDGQTIYQEGIFGKHVKKNLTFPDQFHPDQQWHANRMISEAIAIALNEEPGPVHINFPFREPFYPETDQEFKISKDLKVIKEIKSNPRDLEIDSLNIIAESSKVMLLVGQNDLDHELISQVSNLVESHHLLVLGDILSNIHPLENRISLYDNYLPYLSEEQIDELKPEILITVGDSVISKSLKIYLREHSPSQHIHIQEYGIAPDTFTSLTYQLRTNAKLGLKTLFENLPGKRILESRNEYKTTWSNIEKSFLGVREKYQFDQFTQLEAVSEIIQNLPGNVDLHLSNSMGVRLANYIGLRQNQSIEVFCNRGTSGIDGSTSTAVGTDMVSSNLTALITGDMAFFYDRNAFWNNYSKKNLRIIILNNHAGGIFGVIKGPSEQPELEEYFETKQDLSANYLAKEYDLEYRRCTTIESLKECLSDFFSPSMEGRILELDFDNSSDKEEFKKFKEGIKNHFS